MRRFLATLAIVAAVSGSASEVAAGEGVLSFALVDGAGRRVSSADFPDRWLLVYFGYTHCADQCPTTLSDIAESLRELGTLAERVQPVFITIDPERDRGPDLAAYAHVFDERILALGGASEAVARVAKAFGVTYRKVPTGDGDYVIDHSGALYLLDPAGRINTRFGHMSDPYMIETKLLDALARPGDKGS